MDMSYDVFSRDLTEYTSAGELSESHDVKKGLCVARGVHMLCRARIYAVSGTKCYFGSFLARAKCTSPCFRVSGK